LREAGLLQTFSPDFVHSTDNTMSRPYRYIGNAVPPLLGYLIARKVQSILEKYFDPERGEAKERAVKERGGS